MKIDTIREKGNAGLSLGIAYFGSNGYTVSIPLNDTQLRTEPNLNKQGFETYKYLVKI